MADFQIGTTLGGMILLSALTTPVEFPKSTYQPYTDLIDDLGDGSAVGRGFPVTTWTFPLITLDEYNQLLTFCGGPSAWVYIRTKLNDDTYANFYANMIPPTVPDRWGAGLKMNLTFTFKGMVAQ